MLVINFENPIMAKLFQSVCACVWVCMTSNMYVCVGAFISDMQNMQL